MIRMRATPSLCTSTDVLVDAVKATIDVLLGRTATMESSRVTADNERSLLPSQVIQRNLAQPAKTVDGELGDG
jgi:hypothetical protein